jgi:hypothetical protein
MAGQTVPTPPIGEIDSNDLLKGATEVTIDGPCRGSASRPIEDSVDPIANSGAALAIIFTEGREILNFC